MSFNQAVLRGTLSSVPEVRVLASETVIATLQLTTRVGDGPAISVPVMVSEPPQWLEASEAGTELVVLGTIRRRFFRAGGATASRVEVHAESLARATDRRALRTLMRRVEKSFAEILVDSA